MRDIVILIPARYGSSRFPGKPLALIAGIPLILRVAEICAEALGIENVFIVTDDKRITELCEVNNYQTLISSEDCVTGTDRIASVIDLIPSKIYLNVQGDEPLISPDDILKVYAEKLKHPELVINGVAKYEVEQGVVESSVPKVVMNEKNELMYISRANIPFIHSKHNFNSAIYYRQVCIYAFNGPQLKSFLALDRRSYLENLEDVEILRFFELDTKIKMVFVSESIAVDYPEDVNKVEKILSHRRDHNNL